MAGFEVIIEGHTSEVRLSLFNGIHYRIVLAQQTSGIWFAKGHHFDLKSRKVSELGMAVPLFTERSGPSEFGMSTEFVVFAVADGRWIRPSILQPRSQTNGGFQNQPAEKRLLRKHSWNPG
jgi:hypothetical protein